jgi:hypothetical protein
MAVVVEIATERMIGRRIGVEGTKGSTSGDTSEILLGLLYCNTIASPD